MLNSLATVNITKAIYRLANPRTLVETLRKRGLSEDDISETLTFLRLQIATAGLSSIVEDPFRAKAILSQRFGLETRYSDGSFPVFYGALEESTALSEAKFHYVKIALGRKSARRSAYYARIVCMFSGDIKDLRKMIAQWPGLMSRDDYQFCQSLGRAAVTEQLSGFFAPSVRARGGTTVPVFLMASLSQPQSQGFLAFSYIPNRRGVSITRTLA
jgi:hypothetical protein